MTSFFAVFAAVADLVASCAASETASLFHVLQSALSSGKCKHETDVQNTELRTLRILNIHQNLH